MAGEWDVANVGEVDGIRIGGCYSNGAFGRHWAVRQVVACGDGMVHYKVLAGAGRRQRLSCTLAEFASEFRYPVERNENSWVPCSH